MGNMSKHHYDHIRDNEKFHELVAQKSRLSWILTAMILVVYYSFIIVVAFAPQWLGTPLNANTTLTWGLPVGISIILFTFLITGIYVYRANNRYDSLMQKIIDASHLHFDAMSDDAKNEDIN